MALHKYDPKDLITAFEATESSSSPTSAMRVPQQGKVPDFVTTPVKASEETLIVDDDAGTPVSVLSEESHARRELEFEEELREHGIGGDDSDDDLL